MFTNNLVRGVPFDPLGPRIPSFDDTFWAQEENRIIQHAGNQVGELFLRLPELVTLAAHAAGPSRETDEWMAGARETRLVSADPSMYRRVPFYGGIE